METSIQTATVITPAELLTHWQGHRALTRRTIEAFPEKELFEFKITGMRTYAEIIMELLAIAAPGIEEIVTGETKELQEHLDFGNKKENLLKAWDNSTDLLNAYFPKIKEADFHKKIKTFGQYEGTVQSSILYFIDNEIHHRGQGYAYLRSLNIEPPFFWER